MMYSPASCAPVCVDIERIGDCLAPGTIAACVIALLGGARIFRVHDVAEVRRALEMASVIEKQMDRAEFI